VLTHGNVTFQIASLLSAIPIDENDEQLSFLALAHIAERLLSDFCPVFDGAVISFAESPETVPENIREIAPTFFFAVPRIWEKFYSAVSIAAGDAGRIQRLAYAWALKVGARVAECRRAGHPLPPFLRLAHAVAGATVLRRAKKLIGLERARFVVTGAAPIAPDLIRWYLALGIDMREGYGLTETSGVASMTRAGRRKIGSVGQALPNTQVRISPVGEILVRGGHIFQGYFNDPDKTREAIVDGWLHTGDVGVLDEDGFLRITDRMKDIIITAGGKNITPSEIENQLKFSPYIADAIVIGDRRKYLACLVMIDHENVAKYAQSRGVPFTNYASLCRAHDVVALIGSEVDKVNREFARVEQVKKFRLIDIQLTPEDEELTPTMKLKRKLVSEKYASLIESMYQET
jgi:long-chain acyl-CoA synthetase